MSTATLAGMRRLSLSLSLSLCLCLCLGATDAPARLRLPRGVHASVVARHLGQPTSIAWDSRGGLWTTSAGYVTDSADGVWFTRRPGARPRHVISRLFTALGLTWYRGELYVTSVRPYSDQVGSHVGRVLAFSGWDGRRFHRHRTVLDRIPVGEHTLNAIRPGPGGRLYMGVGSEFDHQGSRHRLSGTVVSFTPRGRAVRIEARGLRNPYGLAFVPGTSILVTSDNGRDDLGLHSPPDELNAFDVSRKAPSFGFPGCFGQGGPACAGARAPLARLAPHASADGVAVAKHWGHLGAVAFVAENGSSFARAPAGNDVRAFRLARHRGGLAARPIPFARGFREHDPLAAAIGPDGALYLGLYRSSAVLRLSAPR